MGPRGYMLLLVGLVFGGTLISQAQRDGETKKRVDFKAERSYTDRNLNRSLGLDDRAMILVGDVVFHHNGAVISCDSAVRHSERRIDCHGSVIINKDSTFVYGERAEYNGDENLARVYSYVIKVVDGDATLYTYNFTFNTLDNVGRWFGGGVLYQHDNVLESENGYFYSDSHELVAVRAVEMRNDSHELTSDSIRYNTDTRVATFYTRTHIWTEAGEMIRADRGRYNTRDSTYFFHDNAYVLTDVRETWADTIDFNARLEDALFWGNIQIDDHEHDSSAFGDFAQYWGLRGETMLTRRPSLLNYNADQGNSDTLYMRADTVFMFVRYPSDSRKRSSPAAGEEGGLPERDTLPEPADSLPPADSLREDLAAADLGDVDFEKADFGASDSLAGVTPPPHVTDPADSLGGILGPEHGGQLGGDGSSTLSPAVSRAEEKALRKAEKQRLRTERRAAKEAAKAAKREARTEKRRARLAARSARFAASRLRAAGSVDSLLDSVSRADSLLRADSLGAIAGPAAPEAEAAPDTTFRIFRGWYNVKLWRSDMQGVCDSIVGFSADSTIHMYVEPLLWHSNSQISADSIVLFTHKEQVERAEFFGDPIMGARLRELFNKQFNQVKGRRMTSWFRDNTVYRHDTEGNAQALYYMQDEEDQNGDGLLDDPSPMAFLSTSGERISFYISDQYVDRISVIKPDDLWNVYPMDQIPGSQSTQLQGFVWQQERQPSLADVFDRRVRPTERAEHEAIPHPGFPIAARIDRRRNYLMENGLWIDRSEPLPAHAVEFRDLKLLEAGITAP